MLTIFRRHQKTCPHTSRKHRNCRCPISVEGLLGSVYIRRSLDTWSWDRACPTMQELGITTLAPVRRGDVRAPASCRTASGLVLSKGFFPHAPNSVYVLDAPVRAWNSNGYFACTFTNDDFWFLDRIDNAGSLYAVKAYAYNSMGTGVRAYVVDSGVWAGHSEFDTRVEAGANMTVDPDVNDPVGGGGEPAEEEPPIAADYSPANDPCNVSSR